MPSSADLALSFGRAAAIYDSVRPSYPSEAIEWVLPAGVSTVLDLGAGTGKLTQLLVGHGYDVVAVDPDPAMLGRLGQTLPNVATYQGTAEQIPLDDASVDAVVCAQAWHWVDREVALSEVARVLTPGGAFGLVWNVLDGSVPWIVALAEATHGIAGSGLDAITVVGEPFTPMEKIVIPWVYKLDRAGVLRLVSSWSQYITAEPADQAAMLANVGAVLDTHPDLAGLSAYPLPYNAYCFRSRRA